MTQLRRICKCGISNDLDRIEQGIGHRGSSFMDFDAVSHDGSTHRFLLRELKRQNERLDPAARITLADLALESRWTVWYLQLWGNGQILWADMRWPDSSDLITEQEYRERLTAWWDNRYEIERFVLIDSDINLRKAAAR